MEGVGLATGRMVRRKVQRVEVELLAFHLGPLGQFPAHRDEGVGDVLGQDRDGVTRPDGLTRRWQGHVDGLGDQYRRIPLGAQHRESVVEGGLGLGAGDIDPLAGVGPVLAGQRAHRLPGQRQRRPIPEMFGFGPGQACKIRGGGECGTGRGDGVGQRGLRQQIGRWLTHATELS